MSTRPYVKRRRAESEAQTRERIARAAMELHETLGIARTTFSDVARRAGVSRVTVYRHFPDELALLRGCSAIWDAEHPGPDPGAWARLADPAQRLRAALDELYAWYAANEAMLAGVFAAAAAVPAMAALHEEGTRPYLDAMVDVLAAGRGDRGRVARERRALLRAAVDFGTWRALCREGGLSVERAAAIAAAGVECAAGVSP